MARLVLSDAAPLICIAQVDGLPWLECLFGQVQITSQVRNEILTGRGKPGEEALASAISRGRLCVRPEWNWPEPRFPRLGQGEESSICAAVNLLKSGEDCLLLVDDLAARRAAAQLFIPITGTAAVVGSAMKAGLVRSARMVFDELQRKGFFISDEIVRAVLQSGGEAAPAVPSIARKAADSKSPKRRRAPK